MKPSVQTSQLPGRLIPCVPSHGVPVRIIDKKPQGLAGCLTDWLCVYVTPALSLFFLLTFSSENYRSGAGCVEEEEVSGEVVVMENNSQI